MRKLTFLISILCVALFFNSCKNSNKTDCERYGLNTNVKSVSVTTYEAESKFGEVVKGDLANRGHYTALFDEEGYLTSITDYDEDGELDSKRVFTYDDMNHLTILKEYDEDGHLDYSQEWVYEGKYLQKYTATKKRRYGPNDTDSVVYKRSGEEIHEITTYRNGEIVITDKYSESTSHKATYVSYGRDGNVLNSTQHTYDRDGHLLMRIINSGAEVDSIKSVYNKAGFLIEMSESGVGYKGEVRYNDKNLPIYLKGGILYNNTDPWLDSYFEGGEQYMEYEYDDKGNWVRQIVYIGEMKEPYQISERTIVY